MTSCLVPYSSFGGGSEVLQLSAEGALECSMDALESCVDTLSFKVGISEGACYYLWGQKFRRQLKSWFSRTKSERTWLTGSPEYIKKSIVFVSCPRMWLMEPLCYRSTGLNGIIFFFFYLKTRKGHYTLWYDGHVARTLMSVFGSLNLSTEQLPAPSSQH